MEKKKPQCYLDKQENLNRAIERVKRMLMEHAMGIRGPEQWNLCHDLQDRLENRLYDNLSEYYDWHWKTYQWNSYQAL